MPAGAQSNDKHDARPYLFISDLHLTPERPAAIALFQRFLEGIAPGAAGLYILGDFFEAWVGDDDLELPFHQDLAARIRRLVDSGVPVYFMPGNRDFLAGPFLARATGWTPLVDPTVIDLYGTPTLISHGDTYCTDDKAYQAFRLQVRDGRWQADFLEKPIDERRDMARAIRAKSEQAKAGKKPDIMDVNPQAIREAMVQAGVARLIHGHTHRPARHELSINGAACERWVLADWYETGGYLACDPSECRAESFP
jgi:UDP-2,3-diacylglucosamine hydrolase